MKSYRGNLELTKNQLNMLLAMIDSFDEVTSHGSNAYKDCKRWSKILVRRINIELERIERKERIDAQLVKFRKSLRGEK